MYRCNADSFAYVNHNFRNNLSNFLEKWILKLLNNCWTFYYDFDVRAKCEFSTIDPILIQEHLFQCLKPRKIDITDSVLENTEVEESMLDIKKELIEADQVPKKNPNRNKNQSEQTNLWDMMIWIKQRKMKKMKK